MDLLVKSNVGNHSWEIHDHHGFVCELNCEERAHQTARALNILPYLVKALRMWTEHRQRGLDLTSIDIEWTKRVLAVAEARITREQIQPMPDPPSLP